MAAKLSPGVYVDEVPLGAGPIAGVGTSTAGFVGAYQPDTGKGEKGPDKGVVKLVTNFTEFVDSFGDFSANEGQNLLAHAVYGFFNNGGTRCYVTRIDTPAGLKDALEAFEPIDDIAIVAAPGVATTTATWGFVSEHCRNAKTRFALLDAPRDADWRTPPAEGELTGLSPYAAIYFPWIQVQDPATNLPKFVPPSGHMAGIYARVDQQRGVHKAPANEPVFGALGLRFATSQRHQDGLNPIGVNCIRRVNGAVRVWGARTANSRDGHEFKYVSTRRLFNFIRGSIEQGTQWAVFEPNNPDLWAKITRNVSSFLTTVWSTGALYGLKPEEAFFVKCDAENNPPQSRDLGYVVAEIGVAITKPAEFVVFRLGQRAGS